jgi:hypothetical protein
MWDGINLKKGGKYFADKYPIKTISLDPENSSPKAAVHTKLL